MGWALNQAIAVCKGAIQPDTPYPDLYLDEVFKQAKFAHRGVQEVAKDVGHEAHTLIEGHLKGEAVFPPEDIKSRECADRAIDWMGKVGLQPVAVESYVYSRRNRCAGMLDTLAYVEDELAIVDWKSSKAIYPEYWLQTAAYQGFHQEETGDRVQRRYLVKLGKEDGQIEVQSRSGITKFKEDWQGFLGALRLTRSLERLKGDHGKGTV